MSDSVFERFLDIILPSGGCAVVLAEVFIDESGTHDGAPVLCVGGYVLLTPQARRLDKVWRKILTKYDLPYFRMSACANGGKPFGALNKGQRTAAATECIEAAKKCTQMGFVVSINEPEYDDRIKGVGGLPSAYAFCLMQAFFIVRRWADQVQHKGKIAYFFESGHAHQGESDNFLRREVVSSDQKKDLYRYAGHAFVDKRDALQLQTADILAWQWYHYHSRRPQHGPRKDLQVLLRPQDMVLDFSSADIAAIQKAMKEREDYFSRSAAT